MALYICRNLPRRNWVTEADFTDTPIENIEFYMANVSKTAEAVERAEKKMGRVHRKKIPAFTMAL